MLIDNSSVCDQDHLEIVDIFLTKFMTVCFNGRQNIFFSIFQSRRREDRVILTKKIFFEIFIIFRNEARVGVINIWNKSSHGGLVVECLLDNLHALLLWVRISVLYGVSIVQVERLLQFKIAGCRVRFIGLLTFRSRALSLTEQSASRTKHISDFELF